MASIPNKKNPASVLAGLMCFIKEAGLLEEVQLLISFVCLEQRGDIIVRNIP
jgi:hypothetical protein